MAGNKAKNIQKKSQDNLTSIGQNNVTQKNTNASEYVTVAYNSPRGITFTLQGKTIEINGNNSCLVGKEKGILSIGLYGYTRVLSEDWNAISNAYGSMDIFKNGLIFAEASKERSEDKAKEQAELRNGLEPVNIKTTRTEEASNIQS